VGMCIFGGDGGDKTSPRLVTAFSLICLLVKTGNGSVRTLASTGQPVARDLCSKLLALELLLHLLKVSPPRVKNSSLFAYTLRRILVHSLLQNLPSGLDDARVFRRLLGVVTGLWTQFRRYLKVEIVVLVEYFMLRILRLGPQVGHKGGEATAVPTAGPTSVGDAGQTVGGGYGGRMLLQQQKDVSVLPNQTTLYDANIVQFLFFHRKAN